MTAEKRQPEFKFTYRSMVLGALVGSATYAAFKDVRSMLIVVKYGTWLAIAPMSLLLIVGMPLLKRKLRPSTISRTADALFELSKFLVGHGLAFYALCLFRPF